MWIDLWIKKSNKYEKQLHFGVCIIIFTAMFILNKNTELYWDDFNYYFIFRTNEPIHTLLDIVHSQRLQYLNAGGRIPVHFIAQIMLHISPVLFDFINSAMYLILLHLVLYLADVRRHKGVYLFLVHMCLLFAVPEYGQCFLWLTGSCNYLFGMILSLLPIAVYVNYYRDGRIVKSCLLQSLLIFILAFLGGWSQENTGCIVILLLILITCLSCKKYQKKADTWMYIGIIASIMGYLLLILAPGNYVRLDMLSSDNIFIRLIKNIIIATMVYFENCTFLFVMLIVAVMLIILGYKNQFINRETYKNSIIKICIYMICSVISMYILIAAYIATRAMVCPVIMILIAILGVTNTICHHISEVKVLICAMAILLIPNAGIEFIKAYDDISAMTAWWNSIEDYIYEEKESGNRNIVVEDYVIPKTKYTPYQSEYLDEDTEIGPNIYICNYYNIDSIIMKKK